ncbi:MAG TPA: TIGR03960 family B12-binding radical SAM protein [Geobacteraceae bacterium]
MTDNQLLHVEKPVRYMGGEMGAILKEHPELRFVLAFPDVYEVGMSHLGFQILYSILNGPEWLAAERVYAPWPDREAQLRDAGHPLTTLESGTPLAQAEIIGFTLQYELSYTNILNMLDLAGIPLLAVDRDDQWPLILGGGPCAYNPEPLADFFDAFLLGDGEEACLEIASCYREWRQSSGSKDDLLARLANIPGVYVPSLFQVAYAPDGQLSAITPLKDGYTTVRRRFVTDLAAAPYPTAPVVPFLKTVHDRVSMEIGRGCTRGCRFCQAGYIYRPVRERSPAAILDSIDATLRATGYDEVSLLSLATGDYGCLTPLLRELMARYADSKVAVSFPSLRVGTLSAELVDEVRKVRKTGFTLAPEAGSERLRQIINKGISEEALLNDARAAYGAGWRLIKLYFMIGLPGENDDDLLAIADLAQRVKAEGKKAGRGGEVNVSVSTFVPKPHTPFQWEPQIGYEETLTRQNLLRLELKRRKLNFKWHDAPLSIMEGVFARGDRRLGAVLREAVARGCRFDGWSEHFNFRRWQEAFVAVGMDPHFYLRRREPDELLPWDHLDCGVSREYLRKEHAAALAGTPTGDCRNGACGQCGVCDFKELRMRTLPSDAAIPSAAHQPVPPAGAEAETSERIRIRFTKTGAMRFLSHLELINLFTRAVGRAGIPIRFSHGFHPHPKFSFATALSVGVESWAEYLDLEITPGFGPVAVLERLNAALPTGMTVLEAWSVLPKTPSLSVLMARVRYRVTVPDELAGGLPDQAAAFLALDSHPYRREKKGGAQEFDLRHELHNLTVTGTGMELEIGRGKPLEFVAAITGRSLRELGECRIEKREVIFNDPSF